MSRRILILRPEPGASATAVRARTLGLEPIICPLFAVGPVEWNAPDPQAFDAVMMTSANASRMGGTPLRQYLTHPLYAIGAATAAAASAAGFANVHSGETNADALLAKISTDGHRTCLHLAGEHHRAPPAGALSITRRIVYAAQEVDPAPALDAEATILIHSPRAGARLAMLIAAPDRASRTLIAISAAAAQAAGIGWARIEVARAPSDDELLACAVTLCKIG